jgi:hypothetical protein
MTLLPTFSVDVASSPNDLIVVIWPLSKMRASARATQQFFLASKGHLQQGMSSNFTEGLGSASVHTLLVGAITKRYRLASSQLACTTDPFPRPY